MKKLSLLLAVAAIVFVGCDPETRIPVTPEEVAPTNYTQKAVLEYFSGAWCGYCPDGRLREEAIRKDVDANKFMSIVYHRSDNMDNVYDDAIDAKFCEGYPTGMINRINGVAGSRGEWPNLVNAVLGETAKCGLAISSEVSGDQLSVNVKLGIGGADLPEGNYFLTVVLVEDQATGTGTGWDQRNYYSQNGSAVGGASHPYYSESDPIIGYVHHNVARGVLQDQALGMKIDASALAAGAITEFPFTWDIQGLDSDLKIVAFISEFTDNITTSGVESSFVYNAQIADVGTTQAWD